ncbi:MAG TPA: hypothetical protein VKJ45_25370 [Blastocatellia bacterium]|nr:hypothetical protein [Blastocatellia bacterium]
MRKRISLILLIISASALSACTRTARLYPVQGPLSAQTPTPVFFPKITGLAYPSNISLVLSGGELCKGRWTQVVPTQLPKGANAAGVQITAGEMSSVWDSVYGPGYYVAHVLGTYYYYESVISGNRGTVINLELYLADSESHRFKGVARDNKGNIYKLIL